MILECLPHNIKELPRLSPENMTKTQLLEFIPKMLSLSEGRSHAKPEWWPEDTPLALEQLNGEDKSNEIENGSVDTLRQIVTKCYQYLGHADLLNSEQKPTVVQEETNCELERSEINKMEESVHHTNAIDELMDLEVEEIQDSGLSDSSDDIIIYSEDSDTDDNCQEMEMKISGPTYLIGNSKNFKSHFDIKLNTPKPKLLGPKCARRQSNVPRVLSQVEFLNCLGLKSTSQLEQEPKETKKEVDIDCEILEVDEFERHQICSPRSSRTLMSQMSRDMENSPRKRLSFCATEYISHYDQDESEDSSTQIQGYLLRIPFSSLLGTRLKRHVRGENTLNIIYDPSEYCGTSPRPEFTDKLRIRPQDFPVTFKRRRKGIPKHSHEIKFSKADKKKFLIRVKTGLTERSRQLKRLMKSCRVVLNRVTDDEIKRWAKPMFHDNTVWTIDDDISIVAVDIPMSNINRVSTNQKPGHVYKHTAKYNVLSPGVQNPVMRDILCENRMKCLTSEPRPCFLIKKVEKQFNENNGDSSSKMVYIPVSQEFGNKVESQIEKSASQNSVFSDKKILCGNRRKQNFQVRQDLDDNSIASGKRHRIHREENHIKLLKNKLQSDSFQPYKSILPKSYDHLQRALKNVSIKPFNSDCDDVGQTKIVTNLSSVSSAPVCQNKTPSVSPSITLENKRYTDVVPVADEFTNCASQELKISSVYSLQTDSCQTIRKELGRIGCFSSISNHSMSEKHCTDQNPRPTTSNSGLKANNCTSSVVPNKDKLPHNDDDDDDDDDCICIGEIITIDDDD